MLENKKKKLFLDFTTNVKEEVGEEVKAEEEERDRQVVEDKAKVKQEAEAKAGTEG